MSEQDMTGAVPAGAVPAGAVPATGETASNAVDEGQHAAALSGVAEVVKALSPSGMDASDFQQRLAALNAIRSDGQANLDCTKFRCGWF